MNIGILNLNEIIDFLRSEKSSIELPFNVYLTVNNINNEELNHNSNTVISQYSHTVVSYGRSAYCLELHWVKTNLVQVRLARNELFAVCHFCMLLLPRGTQILHYWLRSQLFLEGWRTISIYIRWNPLLPSARVLLGGSSEKDKSSWPKHHTNVIHLNMFSHFWVDAPCRFGYDKRSNTFVDWWALSAQLSTFLCIVNNRQW